MININSINDNLRLGMLDLEAFAAEQNITVKRETEKKATLFLLKKLFPENDPQLEYDEQRKPFLAGLNTHISISHSHDKLAILINSKESTGVDVELIREKVKNIQHKFLCSDELVFAAENEVTLTILWAAKEAIYKAYGLRGVDFSKHIFIEPFDLNEDLFYGRLEINEIKKKYLLKKEKPDNYILVYILNEV